MTAIAADIVGTVARVMDGNTFEIVSSTKDSIISVRLCGVHSPSLGFSGIYERYLASQAGFADDAKGYRAVVEAESARTAVVAETAAVEE